MPGFLPEAFQKFFGPSNQQQSTQQQLQQQNPNVPTNGQYPQNQPTPNGIGPAAQGNQQQQQTQDPLAEFATLFSPVQTTQAPAQGTSPQNNQQPPQQQFQPGTSVPQFQGYLPALDPKQFQERLSKTNFVQNINQELVQKALTGDAAAFMQILNQVQAESFARSMQMTQGMVEQGAGAAYQRMSSEYDTHARAYQLKTQSPDHQVLQHPAVQPMIQALTQTIAMKDPSLTPAAALQKAQEYFLASTKAVNQHDQQQNQQQQLQTQQKNPASQDWNSWVTTDPSQQSNGAQQSGVGFSADSFTVQ